MGPRKLDAGFAHLGTPESPLPSLAPSGTPAPTQLPSPAHRPLLLGPSFYLLTIKMLRRGTGRAGGAQKQRGLATPLVH